MLACFRICDKWNMATSQQDIIVELERIKNSAFDIRGYFNHLFPQLLTPDLLAIDRFTVVNELLNETTLRDAVSRDYPNQDYVLFFYAHAPNPGNVSPYFPHELPAHTSLLLAKVSEGKIKQLLNIDGYHFTSYVDILGERSGATPNPLIRNRLVIGIRESDLSPTRKPLQAVSWRGMNCVFYAFAFVQRILRLFMTNPQLIADVFPANILERPSEPVLTALGDGILAGMEGKYVKRENGRLVLDNSARDAYHQLARGTLAETVTVNYAKERSLRKDAPPPSAKLRGGIFQPPRPLGDGVEMGPSNFTPTQIGTITKVMKRLKAEYESRWPYPNKKRKLAKYMALEALLSMAKTMSVSDAIDNVEKIPGVRDGAISTRTADLLDRLRSEASLTYKKQ